MSNGNQRSNLLSTILNTVWGDRISKPIINFMFDLDKGYMFRVSCVGILGYLGYCSLYDSFVKRELSKPLAKRWNFFLPPTPITLVDKRVEKDNSMVVYRFQLPNSYDTAGYEPISAVLLSTGLPRWHWSYYNPISPPDAKGYIEFAIGHRNSSRRTPCALNQLKFGEKAYLNRWMKEWKYRPNTYGEIGVIATTTSASIILQLMKAMEADKTDATKLRVLYCHVEPHTIPFKDSDFADAAKRQPGRFFFNYLATSSPTKTFKDGFLGTIGIDHITQTMPPPLVPLPPPIDPKANHHAETPSSADEKPQQMVRSQILCSGKRPFQERVCGAHRIGYFHRMPYIEPWYMEYYNTLLHEAGYLQKQVYAFGVVRHVSIAS